MKPGKPDVDARVIVRHKNTCRGGWKLDARFDWNGDSHVETDCIKMVTCDRLGRRLNGGIVFYYMCCTSSYDCPALAIVRKGALGEAAKELLSRASLIQMLQVTHS